MTAKDIIEMKQKRAKALEDSKAIYSKYEGKEMPAEDKASMDAFDKEFDSLTDKINDAEKRLNRERIAGEKPAEETPPGAKDEKSVEFMNYLRTGDRKSLETYNSLSQSQPTQTGYLIPPEKFVQDLITDMADTTFMRQKANVLPALQGAHSLGYPTRTSGMSGGAWGTEVSAAPEATDPTVGKREFKPHPFTALLKVSKTLIRNYAGADGYVRNEYGRYYGSEQEQAYMTGDGANKPLGVFTASNDGIPVSRDVSTGNTATEIKFDGLIEAMMSVKAQYRSAADWILSRTAIKQLMKLKDSNGQYIWQPSVQTGQPDRLLSHAVNESEYVPATFTAGLYVGLFGNLKNYWIVDSLAMEMQVLYELYATTNQIGYIGRFETDGAPIIPESFARIKLGS